MTAGPEPEQGPDPARSPEEAAAFWDARLRSPLCTPADRSAFAAWRDADAANAAAFQQMQDVLGALHEAYSYSPELRALRDAALRPRRPQWAAAAAGIAAVAVLIGGGALAWRLSATHPIASEVAASAAPSVYQTAGEERTAVQLSDGSKVTLNIHSRLEVTYTAVRRSVRLVSGQALFDVAKNAARPFVVTAGSQQVTAVGTAFDVRLEPSQVQVTMVEGRVKVRSDMAGRPEGAVVRDLTAGQQLIARTGGPIQVAWIDARNVTSWTEGRILFEDTPLPQALGEINRYLPSPIRIGDPALANIKINGMFRTDQPMSFVRALTSYLPLELRSDASGPVLTAKARRAAP